MNKNINFISFQSLLYIIIFFQIVLFFLIFGPSANIFYGTVNLELGDFPSYILFDFSSLDLILGQHRNFGLPIILKLFKYFNFNYNNWPEFLFIFFSLSNILLFYSLNIYNFHKLYSFLLILGLTFSTSLYGYLNQPTELISISLLIISLSFMFISLQKDNHFYFIIFSFFLFFAYMVRPSFVVFTLIPIIFCIFKYLLEKKKNDLIKLSIYSLGPLLIYIILRYFILGTIGFSSFNLGLSGNSSVFLTEKLIPKLKIENQEVANVLLKKKRTLSYPCNLDFGEEQLSYYSNNLYGQYPCWGVYLNSNWLEMIKRKVNLEPFPQGDYKNIEPWLHMKSLGTFWQNKEVVKKHVEIDNSLLRVSKDIYIHNLDKVVKKIFLSPIYFFKLQRDMNGNLILFFVILLVPLVFFSSKFEKKDNQNSNELSLTIAFVVITLGNLLVLYGHQNGDERSVIIQTFYSIPISYSYILFLIFINLNKKMKFK